MKRIKSIFTLLVFLFTLTLAGFAQERTGTIEGTVKDQNGAVVPGATVTITGEAVKRTSTTDDEGYYRFPQVPPGTYAVEVSKSSFQTVTNKDVLVRLGNSSVTDFELKAGAVDARVDITGDDAVVDTTASKITDNITTKEIETLPKGTNFSTALRSVAPVRPEVTGGGFQIDGASGSENTFVIDGQEVTNFRTGTLNAANNVPFSIVNEVQVKTNGFEAEFGGATGGVVNVVTKRGGNEWHGELGIQFEPSKLFASPRKIITGDTLRLRYIQPPKPSFTNTFPTVTLSGPVFKDKLYFFVNSSPQFFPTRTTFRFADGSTRTYDEKVRRDYTFARLDATLSSKLSINATYLYNPIKQNGVYPGSLTLDALTSASQAPTVADQANQGGRIPATNFTVEGTYTPTSNIVFNARYGRSYLNEKITSYGVPSVVRYTCSTGGAPLNCATGFSSVPNNFATVADISKRNTFDASLGWFVNAGGRHNFKFGYQLNRLSNDVNEGYVDTGIIDFSLGGQASDRNGCTRPNPTPAPGCPADPGAIGVGTLTLFGTFGKASSKNQAFFVQDSWQLMSRLTLNLGVRLESEDVPTFKAGAPGIKFGWGDKIAPRLGAAFDVFGNGKWKLFGSYGWFYDRFKYELPRGSFGGDIFLVYDFVVTNPNITSYTRASILANNINVTDFRTVSNDPRNNRIDPDLKAFRQSEFTVGSEYEVTKGMIFATRFTHKQVDRAIEDIGYHNADDDEEYFIGNPGFGVCAQPACGKYSVPGLAAAAKAERKYNAVEFRLSKRFNEGILNGYFFDANYTYSRLFGNYAGLASSDEAQRGGGVGRNSPNVNRNFDLPFIGYTADGKPDNGRLPTDRPHVFKINTGYSYNWFNKNTNTTDLYGFWSIGSGTPVTSRFRIAFVSGQILSGRGDQGRTDTLSQFDAGLRHTYKFGRDNRYSMSFGVEVLNVLNSGTELSRRETITRLNIPISTFGCSTLICIDRAFFNGAITTAKVLQYANTGTNKDQRYNQPQLFQDPRSVRFGFNFNF